MHHSPENKKLIRITTVPMALSVLLPGQMNYMNNNGFEVLMISADGIEREAVIKNEKCRHIIVPMTRQITPFQDLKCLWQLIKIIKQEKPDIVHTHTPKAGLLGMLAAFMCSVRIRIHTVAGLPLMVEKGTKLRILIFIEKVTYAAATHVWPNSRSLKTFIIQKELTKESKLDMVLNGSTNGIDLKRYSQESLANHLVEEVKNSINYDITSRYLLCIGRLVKDKGIIELVDAFLLLQKKFPALKLILVGSFEDELDPLPEKTLEEIRQNNSIIHIQWSKLVEYYMSLAHLFIFPSHREGFPNVLLQAGAMNLPVICSNIPGNIDIIKHQHSGLIFEKGNVDQIVKLVGDALDDYQQMISMSHTLKTTIHSHFKREEVWKEILNKYHLLLQQIK